VVERRRLELYATAEAALAPFAEGRWRDLLLDAAD